MGITRDYYHKRRSTGGRRVAIHKKRKFESGRPAAQTRLGEKRIKTVRTRGGHQKYRALRLDSGNFSWASESTARKTRIIDVVYNPTNNELVRTNTLTKGAIVVVDATPFRQFYATKYNQILGAKKGKAVNPADQAIIDRSKSKHLQRKLDGRKAASKVDAGITDQAATGRVLARLTSRPGQSGRGDGYILEGKELEFYQRKIAKK
jgi:small subunit ribosomal protein S8e